MGITVKLVKKTLSPCVNLFYKKKYNIDIIRNDAKKIKGPYVIIGNHTTDFDSTLVVSANKSYVHFLAGDRNMDMPFRKFALTFLETVPFKKNKADFAAIRKLIKYAKKKESIAFYPEGGRCWDGKTDKIIVSTGKFIKLLGIDVYVINTYGGYLSSPRWSEYDRKGKIEITTHKLLGKEQIPDLSVEQINEIVRKALYINDFEWQKSRNIKFKGKNKAEGIERLLYKCPICTSIHTLKSSGDSFSCFKCGGKYYINDFGFIDGCKYFDDTVKWNEWQSQDILKDFEKYGDIRLNSIKYEQKDGKKRKSKIIDVVISADSISLGNQKYKLNELYGHSVTLSDTFEFYIGPVKHRLVFDYKRHISIVFVYNLLRSYKENFHDK